VDVKSIVLACFSKINIYINIVIPTAGCPIYKIIHKLKGEIIKEYPISSFAFVNTF